MSELALKLIREAKQKRLTRLDLGKCGLTEIPEELFELTWLEELVLSNVWWEWNEIVNRRRLRQSNNLGKINVISELPQGFNKLTRLKKLVAAGTQQDQWEIQDLSPLMGLTNLLQLNLSQNQVSELSALSGLRNLTQLDLNFNQVSDLSALSSLWNLTRLYLCFNYVSNLSALSGLWNLTQLDLMDNLISDLSALSSLRNLMQLDLDFNQVSDLSALSGLWNLKQLSVIKNQVSSLNALSGLLNLTELNLAVNQISDLSMLSGLKSVMYFDLSYNQISDLSPLLDLIKQDIPLGIERSYDFPKIIVGGNPLVHPPLEIVEQGNQAVLDYFAALEKGTAYLNEAKLIIVGEPVAGKTSLMECLWNPAFCLIPEADSQSTLGIEVREGWTFPHPEFKEVNFSANIWDFGGQHIQYMTHQFFLTPNAVYVLVAANDRDEYTNFPYWFKIINLLGQDQGRYSPVIVVLNEKSSQFHHKFDRAAIERQYPHIPLKVCEVNLAKRDHKFFALQQTIQETLVSLPLVKAVKPAAWQPIREALRKRAKRDAHINFQAYVRICHKHGVKEHNQQLLFLRYLHRLGSLLYFEKDENLSDFIILNPKWAVDAVYCVIADKKIAENNGYFTRAQLDTIWASKKHKNGLPKYNEIEQHKLFNLMKKDNFEICYALTGRSNEFIAPQLLLAERPVYNWDNNQNLKFRYQYEFMPEGIMARLMVRLSHLLQKQNGCDIAWRQGMLLEDQEKACQALIQEAEIGGLKVIDIAINGNIHQRKYLLYTVRQELNALHKRWFSNIQVEQMIPCSCVKCSSNSENSFYFEFEVLKGALENNLSRYICNKSYRDVYILSLLEGIYQPEEIRPMSQEKTNTAPSITNNFYGGIGQVGQGTTVTQNQYNQSPQITIEQRQNLNELIKALRKAELSDEEMDIVDAARQLIREDEKQSTPQTQGRLVKLFNGVKEVMDLSNNTIGVASAILPALPAVIQAMQQALS